MKNKKVAKIFETPNLDDAKKRTSTGAKIYEDEYSINEQMKNIGQQKKFFLRTYGCQMNVNDSEKIAAILEDMSYEKTEDYTEADVILLNTCAIREGAENKVFGFLGSLKPLKLQKPNLIIGMCGCMPQEESTINEIYTKHQHLDIVFGTHNIHRLPILLQEALFSKEQIIEVWSNEGDVFENLPIKRDFSHKAWITIMFGCDRFCTYCIVPYTRGKERSRLENDIVDEVKELIANGYKEITLLGQNVNSYGMDLDDNVTLSSLIEKVAVLDIPRIRVMTSNPWNFSDELIETMAKYDNVMPHVHLPIQSGNDKILKLMGRRHTAEEYKVLFDKIKSKIKNVSITTDIIVGFPNETEEEFNDTLEIAKYCNYDAAYTFIYSKREGTPAAKMNDTVSLEEKKARLQRLNEIINASALNNNNKFIGKKVKVLVDGESKKDSTVMSGYTEQSKIVNFKGSQALVGKIVEVEITSVNTWSLYGNIVE